MATWPNPNDYVEALQNPRLAFADKTLQNGQVRTDKLGLPRAISGNFAIVFEVETGRQTWAVRCFSREVPGQEQRYAAISRYLQAVKLPYTVGFQYLPEGVRVKGRWYPVVKMEWVKGARLDTYVESQLKKPEALKELACRWEDLARDMDRVGLAHGDLQHGNIVIADQQIKLIDYDGMIVPELAGRPSGEIGHRHYQHPSRTTEQGVRRENFIGVDHFSSWVIWLSLLLLSIDPALWAKTQAGDDRLLFKEKDFKEPNTSKTMALLASHPDARVRRLASILLDLIQTRSYLDIPPITGWDGVFGPPPKPLGSDWVQDYLPKPPTLPEQPAYVEEYPTATNGAGLLDFPRQFVEAEKRFLLTEIDSRSLRARLFNDIQWQVHVRWRVRQRFNDYPLVQQKKNAEDRYNRLKRQIEEAQRVQSNIQQRLEEMHLQIENEIRSLTADIDALRSRIQATYAQEQQEIEYVREYRRQEYLNTALSEYPIKQGEIPKFGKARVDALHGIGVYTAAHIIPGNEGLALEALSAVHGATPQTAVMDWRRLETWRRRLEKSIPFAMPDDSPELLSIEEHYAEQRDQLAMQMAQKQERLEAVSASRTRQVNSPIERMEAELLKAQGEVEAINEQFQAAEEDYLRYAAITPSNLINKILKS